MDAQPSAQVETPEFDISDCFLKCSAIQTANTNYRQTDETDSESEDESPTISVTPPERKKSDSSVSAANEIQNSLPTPRTCSTPTRTVSQSSHNTTPSQSPENSPQIQLRGLDVKFASQSLLNLPQVSSSGNCSPGTPSPGTLFSQLGELSIEEGIDDDFVSRIESSCTTDPCSAQDGISRSSESGKSNEGASDKQNTPPKNEHVKHDKAEKKAGDKKKRSTAWYNVLNPTYKSRSDDFKRLFKDIPENERLIVDYSCALQKDILVHGRLYVSQNYFCFYANIFRWETLVILKCKEVTSMTKEKTARLIPNAIQICTETEKHFFTSFGARDKTYLMLFRIWQNALMEQPMSSQELWHWVHYSYGEELGLTSDDDDYVAPHSEDEKRTSSHYYLEKPQLPINAKDPNEPLLSELTGTPRKGYHKVDKIERVSSTTSSEPETPKGDAVQESVSGADGDVGQDRRAENTLTPDIKEQGDHVQKQKSSECPTDLSDTTESEVETTDIGEILCACPSHEGKEVLNIIVPLPVDQLFSLIFSGSKFYRDLMDSRKTYDLTEGAWEQCPESGHKLRQVTYTVTLNHTMAKTVPTKETQRVLKHSKPGHMYIILSEAVNSGVPYSDAYTVFSQYCLTRISNHQSRLCVHSCVQYKKSVWGLVKSLIEKTAMQGVTEFFNDLQVALAKEVERLGLPMKKMRKRKRGKLEMIKPEIVVDSAKTLHSQSTVHKITPTIPPLEVSSGQNSDFVIKIILATLIVLLLLNILLFYKLWSLEDQSLKLASTPADILDFALEKHRSLTTEEWIQLIRKQEALHRSEVERWRETLADVVKLIRVMEATLQDLKSSIEAYSASAAAWKTTFSESDVKEKIQTVIPQTS